MLPLECGDGMKKISIFIGSIETKPKSTCLKIYFFKSSKPLILIFLAQIPQFSNQDIANYEICCIYPILHCLCIYFHWIGPKADSV